MAWAYEGLFERLPDGAVPTDQGEQLTFWSYVNTEARAGQMKYRTATIRSGDMLEAEIYPIWGKDQQNRARKAKENLSSEKQRQQNQKRRERYFERLVETNFSEKDTYLTLTFAERANEREARKQIRNFFERVKRRREKKQLPELKYIYVIEGDPEGQRQRIHSHLLISGGLTMEELKEAWGKTRGIIDAQPIQPGDNGLQDLARYMIKQRRQEEWQQGRRTWCPSRNLKKPKIRVSDTKVSNRRVRIIARGFEHDAREIMEKTYPGYRFCECDVMISDCVSGVYIRCKMRKRR